MNHKEENAMTFSFSRRSKQFPSYGPVLLHLGEKWGKRVKPVKIVGVIGFFEETDYHNGTVEINREFCTGSNHSIDGSSYDSFATTYDDFLEVFQGNILDKNGTRVGPWTKIYVTLELVFRRLATSDIPYNGPSIDDNCVVRATSVPASKVHK